MKSALHNWLLADRHKIGTKTVVFAAAGDYSALFRVEGPQWFVPVFDGGCVSYSLVYPDAGKNLSRYNFRRTWSGFPLLIASSFCHTVPAIRSGWFKAICAFG